MATFLVPQSGGLGRDPLLTPKLVHIKRLVAEDVGSCIASDELSATFSTIGERMRAGGISVSIGKHKLQVMLSLLLCAITSMPSTSCSQQDRFIAFLNINKSIRVIIEEIQTLMRSFVARLPELAALELEPGLAIELPGIAKV